MSQIQRALSMASILLVAFLASVSPAAAQKVSVNGKAIDPGNHFVKAGDEINVFNDSATETITIHDGGPEPIELGPGEEVTYEVTADGFDSLKISGPDGDWTFDLKPGMPGALESPPARSALR